MQQQLLSLYENAHVLSPLDFIERSLVLLQQLLPFDKSIFIYGALETSNPIVSTLHLDRLPKEKLHKRLAIKEADPLLVQAIEQRETSVTLCCADLAVSHPLLYQHACEFNQAHVLTFSARKSLPAEQQGLISLYRERQDQPFHAAELRACDQFLPHLFVAHQINLKLNKLAAGKEAHCQHLIAAVDGGLYFLEPSAISLLQQEWPSWSPPILPAPLMATFAQESHFHGKKIYASAKQDRDLLFIRLSTLDTVNLSPAELRVSRWVSKGLSYKEIARQLNVSPSTINNQLQSVYQKLEVNNKVELGHKLQLVLAGHFS